MPSTTSLSYFSLSSWHFFLMHASKEYLDVIWPMLWIISLFLHFSVAPFLITVIKTVFSSAGECVLLCSSFLSLKLFTLTSSDPLVKFCSFNLQMVSKNLPFFPHSGFICSPFHSPCGFVHFSWSMEISSRSCSHSLKL